VADRAHEVAGTITRSLDATVVRAQTLLGSLQRLVDLSAPPARRQATLTALATEGNLAFSNIYVVDAPEVYRGAPTASDRDTASLRDREYFQRVMTTRRFTIGQPVRSRALAGAPWVLPFIAPILDPATGGVQALVGASIRIDSLDAMRLARTLPPGSVVTVLDASSTVLLRSLDLDAWIGRRFPGDSVPPDGYRSFSWGIFASSAIDSVHRVFGTGSTEQAPWRVFVGIPDSYAMAPARAQFTQDILLALGVTAAVILLAWWLTVNFIAPIEALTRDAQAVSAGDMSRRAHASGRDEVGTLARTFNAMADAIVERNIAAAAALDEQKRAQKFEALGSFAGGVAHDFNNYLLSIIGHSEMALDDLPPSSPVRADLEAALASAQGAADLTRQILIFGHRQVVPPALHEPNVIVSGIGRLVRRLLGESVILKLDLAPQLGTVRVDRAQLEQVLMSFAANARDAMPDGGRFLLRTTELEVVPGDARHPGVRAGMYVCITAADTGHGLTPDAREHLFEPYFTTKDRGRGSGLSLAFAFAVAQQAGGAIRADSEAGSGTSFHLYLPRLTAGADRTVAHLPADDWTESDEAPGGTERILLVEDDRVVSATTSRMLLRAGYDVVTAPNAGEALDALAAADTPFALVVTDVIMPGMSGTDLAREVSARYPAITLLLMSGYPGDDVLMRDVVPGQYPFLAKPFPMATLLHAVRRLLDAE
jgi:signal transduction histidine kinase/ActR/RegA family two-component response regulator